MIDYERELIFVENPKAASHSITSSLLGNIQLHNNSDKRIGTINHNTPSRIKKAYPKEWNTFNSFVIVRNTWERAVSFFNFYKNIAESEYYKSLTFDLWVQLGFPPPKEDHLRAPMHGEGRFDNVLCQLRYAEDVDEVVILNESNKKKRGQILQKEIERIFSNWNLPPIVIGSYGSHHDTTAPHKWQEPTIEKIQKVYSKEIERFGFTPPKPRT